ncbi:cytochrome oxidase c subunit VIb-domain-containing protein [Dioszegia hungarica]|uniref:Cytochrome oxidase c subunit VIb-domain-containing protein n=1 Tax=Dioszegia hungarica TaxID=4972 RepID=A0AA38H6Q7_9TREE|nr:cytochrome oxidase c subunit VIb-domain-containing protein [Dioszegia hungarica]KAI9635030.1 cytochrome oxidase c subunit VIb-domain-containing protein [Dioszegia hungarica]
MFGFGSSSASSSTPPPASEPTVAPTREQRKHCWESRDAYFACLDKGNVMVAGGTEPGEAGCKAERKGYEVHCGKSWIDYFNKRRTLELRQKATVEAAARQRDSNPANKGL